MSLTDLDPNFEQYSTPIDNYSLLGRTGWRSRRDWCPKRIGPGVHGKPALGRVVGFVLRFTVELLSLNFHSDAQARHGLTLTLGGCLGAFLHRL